MEKVSEKLINFREQNNLTEEGLANLIGVKVNDIICWEKELSSPSLDDLKLINKFFTNFANLNLINGETYGQALLDKRKELGMTKKDFANLLNVDVYKLAEWEEDIEVPSDQEKASVNFALKTTVDGQKYEIKNAKLINDLLNKNDASLNLNDAITYGQALLNKRKELNMTKKDFADLLNVEVYKLAEWEEDIESPNDEVKASINSVLKTGISGKETGKKYDYIVPDKQNADTSKKFITQVSYNNYGKWHEDDDGVYFQELTQYVKDEYSGNTVEEQGTGLWFIKLIFSVIIFLGVVANSILAITLAEAPVFTFAFSFFFLILTIIAFYFPERPFLSKDKNLDEIDAPDSYYIFIYSAFTAFLMLALIFPYLF